jgi:hypothetical protein
MSVSTIYATYSGRWNHFGGGAWTNLWNTTSQGGSNGGIGGCKVNHDSYGDNFGDCGVGFVQFDTSSLPDNCTISLAFLNVQYTKNNFAFGGVGMAMSYMATGWRTDTGVDEWYSGNILTGNTTPSSGLVNFQIASPNTRISKTGWSKYHIGPSNVMERVSPGIAAPTGADDFNMSGYDASGTDRPKLIITWTTPPAVATGVSSDIQEKTATLAGNVTDAGGGTVSSRGVCWSTSANPTTANPKATSAGSTGAYTVGATGLVKNTTYHYRAYVITENSTQYGSDQTFITDTDPAVTSTSVTEVGVIQAVGNGNVTSDGRNTVSERGFVLNQAGNPTTASTKYQSGSGTGAFSVTLSGLFPGNRYYVRAYCINAISTQYGAEIMFITPSPLPIFAAMI